MNSRLTKSDWIGHGLRTLATDGANALKVGPMAAKLNVSRGSFYWHFRDMADFRSQLLENWKDRTVDQVIREFDTDVAEPDRFKRLLKRAFTGKRGLDRAIRMWAAEDKEVATVVAAVDASRVAYMAKLLVAAGVAGDRAHPRAAFIYWAYLGQATVMDARHASIAATEMDDISDLFER